MAKEPGHRGEHDISRKTIACGNAGRSGVLVVTRVRSTTTKCTRGRGCSGHPAFPTPSKGARDKYTTRAFCAAGSRSRVCNCFLLFENYEVGVRAKLLASPRETHPSCPDLIRASINLRKEVLSKKMDHRVKPGDDDLNWDNGHCEERLVRRSSTSEGGSDEAIRPIPRPEAIPRHLATACRGVRGGKNRNGRSSWRRRRRAQSS